MILFIFPSKLCGPCEICGFVTSLKIQLASKWQDKTDKFWIYSFPEPEVWHYLRFFFREWPKRAWKIRKISLLLQCFPYFFNIFSPSPPPKKRKKSEANSKTVIHQMNWGKSQLLNGRKTVVLRWNLAKILILQKNYGPILAKVYLKAPSLQNFEKFSQ